MEAFAFEIVSDGASSCDWNIEANAADADTEEENEAVPFAGSPAGALTFHFGDGFALAFGAVHHLGF